jgi:hypothetical protein
MNYNNNYNDTSPRTGYVVDSKEEEEKNTVKKSRLSQAFEASKHITLKDLETKAFLNSLVVAPAYDDNNNNNNKWLMNRNNIAK